MTDNVDLTLAHWRSTPFEWGTEDCLLSIADYVKRCTGKDFGSRWRGTYSTAEGAHAHVTEAGGVIELIETSGLDAVTQPARGDIVVVHVGDAHVGGICTGQGVAMRLTRGVAEVDIRLVKILRSWGVK